MGSCASTIERAQGLTADLQTQLERVEQFLASSPLIGDLSEHAASLEDAFQTILTLNLSSVRVTETKQQQKRVQRVTAAVLQHKADHEARPTADSPRGED